MNSLVIRADANAQIGTGHVMRCLALAQAWQARSGKATLVSNELAPALKGRLQSEGLELVSLGAVSNLNDDAAFLIETARAYNAEWVIVDGYHFDANYQHVIKKAGLKLLALDDNGDCEHYYADFILNQNLHATAELYERREPYTKLLLGTRYALLRREFLEWQNWERHIPEIAKRVLVTLGGSDPQNVTLRVMRALNEIDIKGMESIVVIGANNPHAKELEAVAAASCVTMRVEKNATDMPALMAWADVAIAGAGSTVWELAFMGLPSIVLRLAENQKEIARELAARDLGISISVCNDRTSELANGMTSLCLDSVLRSNISHRQQRLVDGAGAARVTSRLEA